MQLIPKYPIQFFTERISIANEEEFLQVLNHYNSKKTIYYSIYSCQEKTNNNCNCNQEITDWHFCNTEIDKIVFDIDNLNSLDIVKKFHSYLLKNNLKHLILFSGQKGFHIYIFTKNYNYLKNPKNSLLNSHNYFIKELNLKVNGNGNSDVDSHILGDVARLMRIPNTLHLESNLYCIPITTEDLILGKNYILNKAKSQNFNFTFYGKELFDISKFDNGIINHIPPLIFKVKEKVEISIDKQKLLNELPPCLQNILIQPYIYWNQRFHLLKYFQDSGYSDFEIESIMKIFTDGKVHPVKKTNNWNIDIMNVQNRYLRRNKSFFSCKKIKGEMLCPISFGLCSKIKTNPLYL